MPRSHISFCSSVPHLMIMGPICQMPLVLKIPGVFTFSPEQDALRDAVRSTLAREAPSPYVRRMIDDEVGVSPDLWSTMADLGWLGLLVPETNGGLGLSMVDAVVVQEEMGKLPLPG